MRRGLGVGALAACVVWVLSVWWEVYVFTGPIPIFTTNGCGAGAGVVRGLVFAGGWWEPGAVAWSPEWDVDSAEGEEFHWWFDWEADVGRSGMLFVGAPLWLVAGVLGAGWGVMRWPSRRRPPWKCAGCGYDLRGIDSGACPECGADAPATPEPLRAGSGDAAARA